MLFYQCTQLCSASLSQTVVPSLFFRFLVLHLFLAFPEIANTEEIADLAGHNDKHVVDKRAKISSFPLQA